MPMNGSGTYVLLVPEYPAIPNTVIEASDWNAINEDIKSALDLALYRDGQAAATANISMGTHKLTDLAPGILDTDATNFDQVFHNPNFVGSVGAGVQISGTKGTVTAVEFIVNSDTFTWNNTTINATVGTFNLAAEDAVWTGDSWSIDTVTLLAFESGTINITANSIALIGETTASFIDGSTAFTQPISDDSDKLATTHYVTQKILGGSFPVGVGNANKLLSQDGIDVIWSDSIDVTVNKFADGADPTKEFHFIASGITAGQNRAITIPNADLTIVGTATVQTLTNKTYSADDSLFTLQNTAAPTKKAKFDASAITAGQTRNLILPDEDVKIFTPGIKYLETFTLAVPATTWTMTFTKFSSEFDNYMLIIEGITFASSGASNLSLRYDLGSGIDSSSSYITSGGMGTLAQITQGIDNNAGAELSLIGHIFNPLGTTKWKRTTFEVSRNYEYDATGIATCAIKKTAAIAAIQLILGSNMNTGTARLYGIRKS